MRTAAHALPVLAALLAIGVAAALQPARADCVGEIRDLRGKLPQLGDDGRRQEVVLLVDKAEKDAQNGRGKLCSEAMLHARRLVN